MGRISQAVHKNFIASDILLRATEQIPHPNRPSVLVDHFPGTVREIHQKVFDDIESRGFLIVQNPREVKYEKMVGLIENASELHLVNSSLLCFALSLRPKADLRIVYLMTKNFYPGHYFYDHQWQEKALHSTHWERYESPIGLDRNLELEDLISKAGKFRHKLADLIFFRNYPGPTAN